MPDIKSRRKVFLFGQVSYQERTGDENVAGLIDIPNYGAIASRRDSLYPYVHGHIRWPALSPEHADLMRPIEVAVVSRRDDVNPLSLAAGYKLGYRGGMLTPAGQERARDTIARNRSAEEIRKGSSFGQYQSLLAVVALIGMIGTALIWMSIPVIGLLK